MAAFVHFFLKYVRVAEIHLSVLFYCIFPPFSNVPPLFSFFSCVRGGWGNEKYELHTFPPNQMLSDYQANVSFGLGWLIFFFSLTDCWLSANISDQLQKHLFWIWHLCCCSIPVTVCRDFLLFVKFSFSCSPLSHVHIHPLEAPFSPWGHQFVVSYWSCFVRRNINRDVLTFGYWDTSNIHQRASLIWSLVGGDGGREKKYTSVRLFLFAWSTYIASSKTATASAINWKCIHKHMFNWSEKTLVLSFCHGVIVVLCCLGVLANIYGGLICSKTIQCKMEEFL